MRPPSSFAIHSSLAMWSCQFESLESYSNPSSHSMWGFVGSPKSSPSTGPPVPVVAGGGGEDGVGAGPGDGDGVGPNDIGTPAPKGTPAAVPPDPLVPPAFPLAPRCFAAFSRSFAPRPCRARSSASMLGADDRQSPRKESKSLPPQAVPSAPNAWSTALRTARHSPAKRSSSLALRSRTSGSAPFLYTTTADALPELSASVATEAWPLPKP